MSLTPTSRIPLPNSSSSIPLLGLGVYKLRDPTTCTTACLAALASGYRHIDTATLYRNAHLVRAAVAHSGLDRSDVFLTTKVGSPVPRHKTLPTVQVEKHTKDEDDDELYQSVSKSIFDLAGDAPDTHVDLLLIHVPGPSLAHRQRLWKTLERLLSERRARAIGVSNYAVRHLEEMREYATTWPPSVNQIELHPWCQQRKLVAYCKTHGIVVQAYSPLATGARLDDAALLAVAAKHDKSAAQVLVRYALQKGWVPLPKSARPHRIRENADVFNFQLDEEDMAALDALDEGLRGARFPAHVK